MQPHATSQIPDDVLRVTEPELAEKLPIFLDRVAHAEQELVVLRDGKRSRLWSAWMRCEHCGMWPPSSWSSSARNA